MIEVIKHGNQRKVIDCSNCGCIFIYSSEDIKEIQIENYEWKRIIKCPECDKDYIIR